MELPEQIARLCARVGCLASPGAPLAPPGECRYNFLTREECHRLYNIGLRCCHIHISNPYEGMVEQFQRAILDKPACHEELTAQKRSQAGRNMNAIGG